MKQHFKRDSRQAALFIVPTQDLVEQQSRVIQKWCADTTVFCFTGGLADPPNEEASGKVCIVSTSQAFLHLQRWKQTTFGWHEIGITVFDEVHHVLKEHPYRYIALQLKAWHKALSPSDTCSKAQVLGLSASLTYDIKQTGIRNTLHRLCHELDIGQMESPSIQELEDGGYVPQHGRNVDLEHAGEVPEGVLQSHLRKPHQMHFTFMNRIENGTSTPFTLKVWSVIKFWKNA